MKVILRHPTREVEVSDCRRVSEVLERLDVVSESVLVIRDGELLMAGEPVRESDVIELRPVISGG